MFGEGGGLCVGLLQWFAGEKRAIQQRMRIKSFPCILSLYKIMYALKYLLQKYYVVKGE